MTPRFSSPHSRDLSQDANRQVLSGPLLVKRFLTVGSVFILFIECLSLILTWAKTNKMMLTMQQLRVFSPISVALWQDGAVYSCVILTLAGLNFLSITRPSFADIPALTDVLFSVALSRFILRLRMLVSAHASAASTLPISTVRFTRPLSDDGDDEDDGVCWAREAGAV
ncbi:hypothetical protein PsYK624_082950 [Phanerochaete sordida]|uniref:Uncharacterized protein n=1 Tax=Phanerochaete sordida TaxID=48140 RepID=A0A9P3LFL8_9APHY|nr:hypothetical protein PsYK624_082950 [Phanerochaete sordida]